MTFEQILDAAIELLQRRRRLTYAALKRQLELDDQVLEDLKQELIRGQRVAHDEDGVVLVWGGQEPHPADAGVEGERRQLTIMFCDLAGSTALSTSLDPEDLRVILRAFQDTAGAVIAQHEGFVNSYMGDGILVFFGYPQAQEDDAERAVRAALEIVAAVEALHPLAQINLKVRVGLATGLVVVGDIIGEGPSREEAVVGQTSNLAARLQSLAQPGEVIISGTTQRLVGSLFDCVDLGPQRLKGFDEPVPAWRITGQRAVDGRFEAAHLAAELGPLVGRTHELGVLVRRWQKARDGAGQVLTLRGEPGIGKSRLALALRESVASDSPTLLRYFCSLRSQNTALFPVIRQLEQAARLARDDSPAVKLDKLEALLQLYTPPEALPTTVPYIAALLSIPFADRYPPLADSPERQKEQTLSLLKAQVAGLARHAPVMIIWEDLHWVDPTSLELIERLIEDIPQMPVFFFATSRPEFDPPWAGRPYALTLKLQRLDRGDAVSVVQQVTGGRPLPPAVLEQILEKSDGVPLFIEELTKTVAESGLVEEHAAGHAPSGPLPALVVPSTLHDSLMARLDRLSTVKEVAQVGAAIGREFSYEVLVAVLPRPASELRSALARLRDADLIHSRGTPPRANYSFKHALIHDAAYATMLRGRRQSLHARIAQVIEAEFPDTPKTEPELLAHHWTEAGVPLKAISYWQKAGLQAMKHSAYVEAVNHFRRGVGLLDGLPASEERSGMELGLRSHLGVCLVATLGYAASEIEQNYRRAHELCAALGDTPRQIPALYGLWVFHLLRGNREESWDLANELHRFAADPDQPLVTSSALAITTFFGGNCLKARGLLEQAMARYRLESHQELAAVYGDDAGLLPHLYHYWCVWMTGKPELAQIRQREASEMAKRLSTPYVAATAMLFEMVLCRELRNAGAARKVTERMLAHSEEQAFPFFRAVAMMGHGWSLAHEDEADRGIDELRQGIASFRLTGARLPVSYYLHYLADACLHAGRRDEGLAAADEALELTQGQLDTFYDPELHRLKGELLLLAPGSDPQAESCFRQALSLAKAQDFVAIELRAATSLLRLKARTGDPTQAGALLAEVYARYDEGLETRDLTDARQLLRESGMVDAHGSTPHRLS